MLFNSFGYLFFMIIVFSGYWLCPHRFRWMLLLGFSCWFYMCWEPAYILLILGVAFVSYFGALLVQKKEKKAVKKAVFIISCLLILSFLFFFKYFNFVSDNVIAILRKFSIPAQPVTLRVLLPVGISFYTFQSLSYLIDVYKQKIEPERHFGFYALYVSFFPQLVAGPIERVQDLMPQLKAKKSFQYEQAMSGISWILIGLFKKIVISNTVSKAVDLVYGNLSFYTGGVLIIATTLFAIQIYCDFSGYSDIALGSARLLGIELSHNFECPYLSHSVSDFWRRWHISLSRWLRDYIYIPLGGNRASRVRVVFNRMVTFFVSGLWHGAAWTYVIWGCLHGLYLTIEDWIYRVFRFHRDGKHRVWKIVLTFILVDFAWIFFRAENMTDAAYVIAHMFEGIANPITYITNTMRTPHVLSKWGSVMLAAEFAIFGVLEYICYRYHDYGQYLQRKGKVFAYVFHVFLLAFIVIFCTKNASGEFIYFQF